MSPGLDVAGPGCRRWPFATCATRYLPYGHLPAAVQAGLDGPHWAIDISNRILAESGISFEPSPPYTQHKNGVAERMIGTLTEKARAMMLDLQAPKQFWAEAIRTASYLHAQMPSCALDGKLPYEMLH